MAISFIEQPELISDVTTPIIFKVKSDNYLPTEAKKFSCYIDKTIPFSAGEKIIFQFGTNRVEMTGVTQDHLIQAIADVRNDAAQEATELLFNYNSVISIARNRTILRWFDVRDNPNNPSQLLITARETGASFNLASHPRLVNIQLGTEYKAKENFKFLVEVFFKKHGAQEFDKIYLGYVEQDFPSAGVATVNISRTLCDALSTSITQGEYYYQVTEIYGIPANSYESGKSTIRQFVKQLPSDKQITTQQPENAIQVRLQSDNYMVPPQPTLFKGEIKIAGIKPTEKLLFTFGSTQVEMVAARHPTVDQNQFVAMGFNTDSAVESVQYIPIDAPVFANYFRRNETLNQYYRIEGIDNALVLTAKNPGAEYNLTISHKKKGYMSSFVSISNTITSGAHSIRRPYFKFLFELFFRKHGQASDFKTIVHELVDHQDGIATIDVSKQIDTALSLTTSGEKQAHDIVQSQAKGEYFYQVSEVYGEPPTVQKTTTSSIEQVTKQLVKDELTLTTQPESLSFSGNPMVFKLKSQVYLDNPGASFIGHLDTTQSFNAGKKICFSFADEYVEMLAVVKPNDSGDQFSADGKVKHTATELAPYFSANYTLNKYYIIEAIGSKIVFTARKLGTFFNWRPDPALTVHTVGIDRADRPNFKFLFELFFRKHDAKAFEKIYAEQIAQDTPFSGIATIDVSRNLDAMLDYDIPNLSSKGHIMCNNSKGEYFCQFAEIYGSPPKVHKVTRSAIKHVVKGGLSHIGFKTKTLLKLLSPYQNDLSKDHFLKEGPRVIPILEAQPETLSFINTRQTTDKLRLAKYIVYIDGNSSLIYTDELAVKQYDKLTFLTGANTLDNSKEIKEYTCYLVNQLLEPISEKITYRINRDFQGIARYFAYTSSLGGIDVLPTYGHGTEECELHSQTAIRAKTPEYELHHSSRSTYNLHLKRKFTVSTGWLSKRRFNLLADFFLAEKKFIVKNVVLLPITVSNKRICETFDYSPTLGQTFEYWYDFDDTKYSEDSEEFHFTNTRG